MKKALAVLLLFCLLCPVLSSLSACSRSGEREEETTVASREALTPGESVFVPVGELPENDALREWFRAAADREQVPGALLYAADPETGLWHCWLYCSDRTEGETLSFSVSGSLVSVLRSPTSGKTDAGGAVYFTLSLAGEPEFELLLAGENRGILVTHAKTAVLR